MLLNKVKSFILENKLIKYNDIIIVGLSGGPDSVFLLNILNKLKSEFNIKLIAAHLDHQWRENSDEDIIFCKNIAEKLDIEFIAEKASNLVLNKHANTRSKEELGRLLRRQFFENLLEKFNANSIALAHHFDDQIETFFIRLIRGAGIAGLRSIKPLSGKYIRPLLDITKTEILNYLEDNKIDYLDDYTNNSDLYLRNKIRKYIVPQLKKCDSRFDKNFKKTIYNLQKADNFIENITEELFNKIMVKSNNTNILYLDMQKFKAVIINNNYYSYLYYNLIIKWLCFYKVEFKPNKSFFDEILKFIKNSKSKEHHICKTWHLKKEKNYLKIIKPN